MNMMRYTKAVDNHPRQYFTIKHYLRLMTYVVLFSSFASVNFAKAVSLECTAPFPKDQYHKLLDSVEKRYLSVDGLSGDFTQASSFGTKEIFDAEQKSKGEVFYKKPGMMDWQYHVPNEQRFVTDGHTLWFYEPDPKGGQVTVSNFESSFRSDYPVSFLLGVGRLSRDFSLKSACKTDDGILLNLVPTKKDASIEAFGLLVREKDYVPIGARTVQVGGNETTITFPKLELRNNLANKQFKFDIPRGVFVDDRRVSKDSASKAPSEGQIKEIPLIEDATGKK